MNVPRKGMEKRLMIPSKRVVALFVLLLISSMEPLIKQTSIKTDENTDWEKYSEKYLISQDFFFPHSPILITNDTELAIIAISGTGAMNDPYLISGWNITASGNDGIYITGTMKYFRIEYCWISNSNNNGIFVHNVHPNTAVISNNICINNKGNGIDISVATASSLINNLCESNIGEGIKLEYSGNSFLGNNTCTNNNGDGISIINSNSSSLRNNFNAYNNNSGLLLLNSSTSYLANNTCKYNDHDGIYISYCDFSTMTENTCEYNAENGISLEYSDNLKISNSTCNNNHINGIDLDSIYQSSLTNNICNTNYEYGIYIFRSHFVTLTSNSCNENVDLDIFIIESDVEIITTTLQKNNERNNLPYASLIFICCIICLWWVQIRKKIL